jgi:predicted double-glycine peptidase
MRDVLRTRGARPVLLALAALTAFVPVVAPSAVAVAANAAALTAPVPVSSLNVVRQTRRNSCGPAAVATLAGWLGRPTSEADVLRDARLVDAGISLAEFARLADLHGVPGSWYRVAPQDLGATPTPFVAHLSTPDDHFVVVHAVVRSHVVMADPAVGAVVVPVRAFVHRFRGRVFVPREAS